MYSTVTGEVVSILETTPIGTTIFRLLDSEGRPTQVTTTLKDDPSGRPRHYDPDKAALEPNAESEPASTTWLYEYTGCAPCDQPTKITDPSDRVTEFNYDCTTFLLNWVKEPNPAGGAPVQRTFTWTNGVATGYSAYYLESFTSPDGTWTNAYQWSNRKVADHGRRPADSRNKAGFLRRLATLSALDDGRSADRTG